MISSSYSTAAEFSHLGLGGSDCSYSTATTTSQTYYSNPPSPNSWNLPTATQTFTPPSSYSASYQTVPTPPTAFAYTANESETNPTEPKHRRYSHKKSTVSGNERYGATTHGTTYGYGTQHASYDTVYSSSSAHSARVANEPQHPSVPNEYSYPPDNAQSSTIYSDFPASSEDSMPQATPSTSTQNDAPCAECEMYASGAKFSSTSSANRGFELERWEVVSHIWHLATDCKSAEEISDSKVKSLFTQLNLTL